MFLSSMDSVFEQVFNPGASRSGYTHHRQLWLDTIINDYNIVEEFRLLKSDAERVTHSLKALLEYDTNRWFDTEYEHKSSKHSIKLRDDGNKSFRDGRYSKAVKEYTESAAYAVDSSEELALAHANRSAALFKLEKYEDCIKDIDRALNLKYPERLRTKLYKRKGLCLLRLGSPGADSSFQEALVWLDKMTLGTDEMNKLKGELEDLISAPTVAKSSANLVQYPVQEILSPSSEIPCASDAVTIKYSKKFGRHLVATRRIKPGELLVLEKPYCSQLEYEHLYTHCSHCLQESWSLIPCKCCAHVTYCSGICENKAWSEYHQVECPALGLLHDYQFNPFFWVSVKISIIATQQGNKLDPVIEEIEEIDRNKDPRTKGFSDGGKFDSSLHRSAYSLSDTADKCHIQQIFRRSLWVALTVCVIARETNMFGKKLTVDHTLLTNTNAIFVGQLMLKHLHNICSNVHGYGPASQDLNSQFACGLLPLCSLANHSCDSNTVRHWHVNHMALNAIYPIEQGEQIFDNYGACCCTMTTIERLETVENWKFTCECLPCANDWPVASDMPSYKRQPLPRKNKKQLDGIMRKLSIEYRTLLQNSSVENLTNMLNELLNAIESLLKLAKKPCKELYMLVIAVQGFYVSGNAIYDYVPGRTGSEVPSEPLEFYKQLQSTLLQD